MYHSKCNSEDNLSISLDTLTVAKEGKLTPNSSGHPKRDTRDTSKFSGYRKYSAGKTPSLKKLAKEVLGVDIQGGEHSSIEDARATMLLFRRNKSAFDVEHASRYPTNTPGSSTGTKKKKKKGKR